MQRGWHLLVEASTEVCTVINGLYKVFHGGGGLGGLNTNGVVG